jgi:ribosomal protein S27E
VAHGFTIKCLKCGSEDYLVNTHDNGEFIEVEIVCEDCGETQVE